MEHTGSICKFGARSKILNKCQFALGFCQRKTHLFERAKRAVLWINKWEIESCPIAPIKQNRPTVCVYAGAWDLHECACFCRCQQLLRSFQWCSNIHVDYNIMSTARVCQRPHTEAKDAGTVSRRMISAWRQKITPNVITYVHIYLHENFLSNSAIHIKGVSWFRVSRLHPLCIYALVMVYFYIFMHDQTAYKRCALYASCVMMMQSTNNRAHFGI